MNAQSGKKAWIAMLGTSLLLMAAATTGCDTPQADGVAPEAARALSLFENVPLASATISAGDAGYDDFDIDRPTE